MRSRHTDITLDCSNRVWLVANRSKSSYSGWIDNCPRVAGNVKRHRFREAMQAADVPKWVYRDSSADSVDLPKCALIFPLPTQSFPLPNSLPSLMRGMYHDSISYLDPCSNPHPHSCRPHSLSCLRSLLFAQDPAPFTPLLLPPFLQVHATQSSRHETPRMDHRW